MQCLSVVAVVVGVLLSVVVVVVLIIVRLLFWCGCGRRCGRGADGGCRAPAIHQLMKLVIFLLYFLCDKRDVFYSRAHPLGVCFGVAVFMMYRCLPLMYFDVL